MNKKIHIGISGSTGRMGNELKNQIDKYADIYNISGELSSLDDITKLKSIFLNSDVIIDFSNAKIFKHLINYALLFNKPLVIGTTNLTNTDFKLLTKITKKIPVLYAENMSVGISLIASILDVLISNFDFYKTEIVDIHHKNKKDIPSGTTIMLSKIIKNCLIKMNKKYLINKINLISKRINDTVGEHTLTLFNTDEIISIKHKTINRSIFALQALRAAQWIINKPPKLYNIKDIF